MKYILNFSLIILLYTSIRFKKVNKKWNQKNKEKVTLLNAQQQRILF